MTEEATLPEKLYALYRVSLFRPGMTIGIIALSLVAAVLEGIGLSFILPIIERARNPDAAASSDGLFQAFVTVYDFFGVPFTLEYIIGGVAIVMTFRYVSSFLVMWFRNAVQIQYRRHLQICAFEEALAAEVSYFDENGSDDVINAIVTQARYAGNTLKNSLQVVEQILLSLIYVMIALYLAPVLTVIAATVLGGVTFLLRSVLESGYSVGDKVAGANERLQSVVQGGVQGIRDVKLFRMTEELYSDFLDAVNEVTTSEIRLLRNQAGLDNVYQLLTVLTVFGLIYVALSIASMPLAALGVFLFAMFRLTPRVSAVNNLVYKIEGELPHLVRTQAFIDELEAQDEQQGSWAEPPETVEEITYDSLAFAYETGEQIFQDLSFAVQRGDFVAFVGPSGAGKSTIVSLLTRMYEPDSGEIRANGTPISDFNIGAWRSRISVVRQNPFIFNDTIRRNVTIGDREASQNDIERACEIAQVVEFLDDLPNGYDTILGDDGVRLSGGQKQRIALARALLKDADFLVLDEATSDLDSDLEETVHQAIGSMDRDCAILVIAHRLSTVVNADRIYTIEEGKIVESGTHETLVSRGGTYSELYGTQTAVVD